MHGGNTDDPKPALLRAIFALTAEPMRWDYVSTPDAVPMGSRATYMDLRRELLIKGIHEVQFQEGQLTSVVYNGTLEYVEVRRIRRALQKWAKEEGFSITCRFAKDTMRMHIELVPQERIRRARRFNVKNKSA